MDGFIRMKLFTWSYQLTAGKPGKSRMNLGSKSTGKKLHYLHIQSKQPGKKWVHVDTRMQ